MSKGRFRSATPLRGESTHQLIDWNRVDRPFGADPGPWAMRDNEAALQADMATAPYNVELPIARSPEEEAAMMREDYLRRGLGNPQSEEDFFRSLLDFVRGQRGGKK